jgi:hypothetical protein
MGDALQPAPADKRSGPPQPVKGRYEDLAQVVRLLIGCMSKLNRATQHRARIYWTQSVDHWIKQAEHVMNSGEIFVPPLTHQLAKELADHIVLLKKLNPKDLKDIKEVADDLLYRLGAMYDSMVTLDGVRMSIAELNLINLKENIAGRINSLSADLDIMLSDGAPQDGKELIKARLDELQKLLPHATKTENKTETEISSISNDIAGQGTTGKD